MLPPEPFFATAEAYIHSTLVVYLLLLRKGCKDFPFYFFLHASEKRLVIITLRDIINLGF